jgi:hypothetical protein
LRRLLGVEHAEIDPSASEPDQESKQPQRLVPAADPQRFSDDRDDTHGFCSLRCGQRGLSELKAG